MMQNLIKQLFKFGIVGVVCFVIDYGIMVFLTELLKMPYLLSCGVAFTVSVIINYLLSMRYVFEGKENLNRRTEFLIFVVLSVIGLGLTELFMLLCVDYLTMHYMVAKILVTVAVMVYNFITRKILLEKKEYTYGND